jgi:L-ornithine Nalpha-acyltransferase
MARRQLVYKRAETPGEIEGSLRLRYEVFCKELKDLPDSACPGGMERDEYDEHAAHFIVLDEGRVVGNTRVVVESEAFGPAKLGLLMDHYYDLTPLKGKFSRVCEMGRTCFLPEFRGRASLAHLWRLVWQYVKYEAKCDLGLSMGACWTDDAAEMPAFFELIRSRGFVSDHMVLPAGPGMANTKPPTRPLAHEPYQPFKTAPAFRMYLDIGMRVLGEPVYVEHFNEYEMLVGAPPDEVAEPYLSFFKAAPKSERHHAVETASVRAAKA